ncbi:M16 family metallopeptidase [Leptolyngbya sp. PCC 6406]|uniref:M16 family metallopeptidase n=1 Tax=Leptolyngbya sp. PCC 6406 TaxID=1173264 RepID=UPI00068712EE|nr:pitrilysin family protein [Leptolyngbya sp. PCC 6406]
MGRVLGLLALLWIGLMGFIALPLPALAQDAGANTGPSVQPYLDRVAQQVTEFTLDNGLKFIVLERHQAPVVSFMLYANVGAVNEEDGKTGVAHYLEHLAFKGTQRIGTQNYGAEQAVLDRQDRVFDEILAAEKAGNLEEAADLRSRLTDLRAEAAQYVEQNKYGQIVEQAGGVGLNATTGADATRYFYSLPSNKLELWMSLESERFLEPVFREFYEEKDVILEERRMRVDNSPIGKLIEVFLETAFEQHPYRRPIIGYADDLYVATRRDVQTFFDAYYGPSNLVAVVVGDVNPREVQRMARAYFGRFSARSLPATVTVTEPPQTETREFTLTLASQPWYIEGYHRPSLTDPDHATYGMIEALLTSGRTARLYKTLVEDQRLALSVGSVNGFPGDQYPNLLLLYALTAPGTQPDDIAPLIHSELDRLINTPVPEADLERVKTQARAALLRQLSSNAGMASLLAEYEAKTGSWRHVFAELQAIDAVTATDVQRVARTVFRPENRTVGKILPEGGA